MAIEFHQHKVISASDIDGLLAKIPVLLSTTGQELWAIFDHVRTILISKVTTITWLSKSGQGWARQSPGRWLVQLSLLTHWKSHVCPCKVFTLLLEFSQFTNRTWTRYLLSMVLWVTGMRVVVKGICLSKMTVTCRCVTTAILTVHI